MATSRSWFLRKRIYGLELDIETLRRDPIGNAKAIAVLLTALEQTRAELGTDTGVRYPVALDLSFYEQRVRVVVDDMWEADRIERAWLAQHHGGGAVRQRAEYSSWAAPLLRSLQQQRKAS